MLSCCTADRAFSHPERAGNFNFSEPFARLKSSIIDIISIADITGGGLYISGARGENKVSSPIFLYFFSFLFRTGKNVFRDPVTSWGRSGVFWDSSRPEYIGCGAYPLDKTSTTAYHCRNWEGTSAIQHPIPVLADST